MSDHKARRFAVLAALCASVTSTAHAAANLQFGTNFLSFGIEVVGETSTQVVTLNNFGDTPATITGFSANAPFAIGDTNCAVLAANASCTVEVEFSPTAGGFYNGQLGASSSDAGAPSPVFLNAQADIAFVEAADPVPGATLLFPYFEVDLDDPEGRNTIVSWRASGATSLLTHVTVWSDVGIPVLTFNTYLTGFDVVSLDLRSVLTEGRLPRTASAGQDPADQISNQGPFSQDINFASCSGELPYTDPVLTPAFQNDLRLALTGQASATFFGRCVAAEHGDNVARGYITVDTVNACNQLSPREPIYNIYLSAQNALAGEYLLIDPGQGTLALGNPAMIESNASPAPYVPGDVTFYGTFNAATAQDTREPLPGTWAADVQAEGAELVVWRDAKRPLSNSFACTAPTPAGFPLPHERVVVFNNEEGATEVAGSPFPLATQRVELGSAALPAPARPGWIYLGLNFEAAAGGANAPNDPAAAQAHVSVLQRFETGQASGAAAHPLDRANDARHVHPN